MTPICVGLLQLYKGIQFAQLAQSIYSTLVVGRFFKKFGYHTVFKNILHCAVSYINQLCLIFNFTFIHMCSSIVYLYYCYYSFVNLCGISILLYMHFHMTHVTSIDHQKHFWTSKVAILVWHLTLKTSLFVIQQSI